MYVIVFLIIILKYFTLTEKLQMQYREFPYIPHHFPIAAILHLQGTCVNTKKKILIHYYCLNHYLGFTSFFYLSALLVPESSPGDHTALSCHVFSLFF